MANITSLLNYPMPSISTQSRTSYSPATGLSTQSRKVVSGTGGMGDAGPGGSPLDALLKGYDAESAAITNKLKSIYDGYVGAYKEFGEEVQPILDAMEGNIGDFETYIGDYEGLLDQMAPDFLNSIIVDPSATRTRAEYMGNIASQYDQARQAWEREAIQQGQNPHANTGANREFKLQRAGALAGGANQAYTDWRKGYNEDITRQQQADAAYAGLYGKQGEMYGDLLGARGQMLGAHKGLYDTRLEAEKARASGYEGLAGLVENRRTQALNLGQQQSMMKSQAQSQANELKANMQGQNWYDPNWNAGGSAAWS